MRLRSPFALALLALTVPRAALADTPVEIQERGSARLVLDGLLRDWGDLREVSDAASVLEGATSWRGRDDASFSFALARDTEALWIAVEVRDDRIVRSAVHRPTEDAVLLSLAAGGTGLDIALQPGDPGNYAGGVTFRGRRSGPVPGASLVEAPTGSGVMLEARIPWAALGGMGDRLNELRARVAFLDADTNASRIESVVATGRGDGQHPADLPLTVNAVQSGGPGPDLFQRFRQEQHLESVAPRLDRRIDLVGDGQPERVAVFPSHIVALGPGIANGTRYTFLELPRGVGVSLVEADTRDVTADGRAEVLVRMRFPSEGFNREVLSVYAVDDAGSLQRVFAHEVQRDSSANRVTNDFSTEAGGRIRIGATSAVGYSASNYPTATEAGVDPPVTPWGTDRAQIYLWSPSSRTFSLERAEPNPRAAGGTNGNVAVPGAQPLPTPVAGPDVDALVALFRQRENIPAGTRPQMEAIGNVAEDPTPETVMVFGRKLLVVGRGYMGGRNYYQLDLPLNEGDTVVSLQLADITGDGLREAMVRVRRNVTSTIQGTSVASQREMVLGYRLAAPRGRVFAVEVGRTVGDRSVTASLIIPPNGGTEVFVDAGSSNGWTAASYPFHDGPANNFFPLLLPWSPTRRITYRWNGTTFVASP